MLLRKSKMNILYFYAHSQTYTSTVYEHVKSLGEYSKNNIYYISSNQDYENNVDLNDFDAILIHYSIRLPYDQIPERYINDFQKFKGIKAVFIQDEYDYTKRAWHWIKHLDISLVFTVVPEENIHKIYPAEELPGVTFVSALTGYIPSEASHATQKPPSQRSLIVGYRGRPLSIRYGMLGQEKVKVGSLVRTYCEEQDIPCDIEWTEEKRIYNDGWYDFVVSCRAMLGSESGSNVFDWDGDLFQKIDAYKSDHPKANDQKIYDNIVNNLEIDSIMNQISPRAFESIACRTVLVLFEGYYSGVLRPWEHFIPLKKDGSNLDTIFSLLRDNDFVDAMADRAYKEIILGGEYSYEGFVKTIDDAFDTLSLVTPKSDLKSKTKITNLPAEVTLLPIRYVMEDLSLQGREYKLNGIISTLENSILTSKQELATSKDEIESIVDRDIKKKDQLSQKIIELNHTISSSREVLESTKKELGLLKAESNPPKAKIPNSIFLWIISKINKQKD